MATIFLFSVVVVWLTSTIVGSLGSPWLAISSPGCDQSSGLMYKGKFPSSNPHSSHRTTKIMDVPQRSKRFYGYEISQNAQERENGHPPWGGTRGEFNVLWRWQQTSFSQRAGITSKESSTWGRGCRGLWGGDSIIHLLTPCILLGSTLGPHAQVTAAGGRYKWHFCRASN